MKKKSNLKPSEYSLIDERLLLIFLIALGEVKIDESADEWLPNDGVINESFNGGGDSEDVGLHVVSSILVKLFVVVVVVLTYRSIGEENGTDDVDTCTAKGKGAGWATGTCFTEPLIGDEFRVKQHDSLGLLGVQYELSNAKWLASKYGEQVFDGKKL